MRNVVPPNARFGPHGVKNRARAIPGRMVHRSGNTYVARRHILNRSRMPRSKAVFIGSRQRENPDA